MFPSAKPRKSSVIFGSLRKMFVNFPLFSSLRNNFENLRQSSEMGQNFPKIVEIVVITMFI